MVVFGGDMPARTSAALLAFNRAESGEVRVFLGYMGGPFWEAKDAGGWSIPKGEYFTLDGRATPGSCGVTRRSTGLDGSPG